MKNKKSHLRLSTVLVYLFVTLAAEQWIFRPVCFAEELIVHEWGTFTGHIAPDGTSLGHLNRQGISDSTLPDFVYRLEASILKFVSLGKGPGAKPLDVTAKAGHPDVTMRLETPVMYFYPPQSWKADTSFDVEATFHGGLLNEYYPKAQPTQNGFVTDSSGSVRMPETVSSRLKWSGIKLTKNDVKLLPTDIHAWLAPRKVKAALSVVTTGGESERYVFYRGVANLSQLIGVTYTPFQTSSTEATEILRLRRPRENQALPYEISALWVLRMCSSSRTTFKSFSNLSAEVFSPSETSLKSHTGHIVTSTDMSDSNCSENNLDKLKGEIKSSLTKLGLFEDEAEAMLDTWRETYFGENGVRILYIVPPQWVEKHLPLKFSVPVKVSRAFIGRIELPQSLDNTAWQ